LVGGGAHQGRGFHGGGENRVKKKGGPMGGAPPLNGREGVRGFGPPPQRVGGLGGGIGWRGVTGRAQTTGRGLLWAGGGGPGAKRGGADSGGAFGGVFRGRWGRGRGGRGPGPQVNNGKKTGDEFGGGWGGPKKGGDGASGGKKPLGGVVARPSFSEKICGGAVLGGYVNRQNPPPPKKPGASTPQRSRGQRGGGSAPPKKGGGLGGRGGWGKNGLTRVQNFFPRGGGGPPGGICLLWHVSGLKPPFLGKTRGLFFWGWGKGGGFFWVWRGGKGGEGVGGGVGVSFGDRGFRESGQG